jgi:hypothetical protein
LSESTTQRQRLSSKVTIIAAIRRFVQLDNSRFAHFISNIPCSELVASIVLEIPTAELRDNAMDHSSYISGTWGFTFEPSPPHSGRETTVICGQPVSDTLTTFM